MKGIYLAAFIAYQENFDIVYQDINGKRDLGGDMLDINLDPYDYIIATPPCNYWSRANYRRETSTYAQQTKHLLPQILHKLIRSGKPFIVENVKGHKRFKEYGLFDLPIYTYTIGRHVYWTNIPFYHDDLKFDYSFVAHVTASKRQGGQEVHDVIQRWLLTLYTLIETKMLCLYKFAFKCLAADYKKRFAIDSRDHILKVTHQQ